jgi:hypothetical protein
VAAEMGFCCGEYSVMGEYNFSEYSKFFFSINVLGDESPYATFWGWRHIAHVVGLLSRQKVHTS